MKKAKRLLSALLALTMLITAVSIVSSLTASAEGDPVYFYYFDANDRDLEIEEAPDQVIVNEDGSVTIKSEEKPRKQHQAWFNLDLEVAQAALALAKEGDAVLAMDIRVDKATHGTLDKESTLEVEVMIFAADEADIDYTAKIKKHLSPGQSQTFLFDVSEIEPEWLSVVKISGMNYGNADDNGTVGVRFIDATFSPIYVVGATQSGETTTEATTETTTEQSTETTTEDPDANIPALDESKTFLKVENVSAKAGDEIEVPVVIGNNPGIWSAKFMLKYDTDALELIGTKAGTVFTDGEILSSPLTNEIYTFTSEGAKLDANATGDGVIITLKFKVAEDAADGDYEIKFTQYDPEYFFDADSENVDFTFGNGAVSIVTETETTTESTTEAEETTTEAEETTAEVEETTTVEDDDDDVNTGANAAPFAAIALTAIAGYVIVKSRKK